MNFPTFSHWLSTPKGKYIASLEQQVISAWSNNIFGFYALQIGLPELDYLPASRIKRRFTVLNSASSTHRASLYAQPEYVPFSSESVDLIIMPHVLELCANPRLSVIEACRMLTPHGYLIISGFNPYGLWNGCHHLYTRFAKDSAFLPIKANMSLASVARLCREQGLQIRQSRIFGYQLPFSHKLNANEKQRIEKIGDRWFPILGAIYVVEFAKQIQQVRLVGLTQRRYRGALKAASSRPPTQKTQA